MALAQAILHISHCSVRMPPHQSAPEPYHDPTMTTATDTEHPPAGVPRRLAAMVYDGLLVFAVLIAATIPAIFIGNNDSQTIHNGDVINDLNPLIGGWPFQLYLLMVFVGFFCWFWTRNGQTLGMQAWRLYLEDQSGQRISFKQCLLRLAGAVISLAVGGAGYWWMWIDKSGLTWHDRWSGTRVVLLPKK